MKLTVTHRDQSGELSASMEIPPTVALSSEAMREYGDALMEVVIGSFGGGEEPPPEEPRGFYPINN